MSIETVFLAVLSGGFVAVVYKSAQDRTERFRDRMLEVAYDFLKAYESASDALAEMVRSYERFRASHARAVEELKNLRNIEKSQEESSVLSGVLNLTIELGKSLDTLNSALSVQTPIAHERASTTLERVITEVEEFEAATAQSKGGMEVAASLKRITAECEAIHDSSNAIGDGAIDARNKLRTIVQLRARLTLVFGGRARSRAVLEAGDRVIERLERLKALVLDATSGEKEDSFSFFEDAEVTDVASNLYANAVEFGNAVSSTVRRVWL